MWEWDIWLLFFLFILSVLPGTFRRRILGQKEGRLLFNCTVHSILQQQPGHSLWMFRFKGWSTVRSQEHSLIGWWVRSTISDWSTGQEHSLWLVKVQDIIHGWKMTFIFNCRSATSWLLSISWKQSQHWSRALVYNSTYFLSKVILKPVTVQLQTCKEEKKWFLDILWTCHWSQKRTILLLSKLQD